MQIINFFGISTVKECLKLRSVEELKKLVQLLPIKKKPTRKAELVETIAIYMKGEGVKKLWDSLNELQQAAVAEAVHETEGFFELERFVAKYGDLPEWKSYDDGYKYGDSADKLDLFFYGTFSFGFSLMIPKDLQAKLKSFVPEPRPVTLETVEKLPQMLEIEQRGFDIDRGQEIRIQQELPILCCQMERTAQQDLLSMLRFVHLGKVSVSDKTLMPGKATIKSISALLQDGDYYSQADSKSEAIGYMKPFAWPMMLQGAGLAVLKGKKLQLTNAGQKALSADPANTIKAIWQKWLNANIFDELRRVDNIKGQAGKGKHGLTAVTQRRKAIAQVLADCPVGRWIIFEDLMRYMIASDRTFEVSRDLENLYIGEAGYGDLYNTGLSWGVLQTAYMRCFLFEYAATLGLLDVAYISPYDTPKDNWSPVWEMDDFDFLTRYDGLLAISLTPLGSFCLDIEPTYKASAIATKTALRVLPNLDITLVGPPLTAGENLMMETFTIKTSDAVWKMDRDTFLKAVANGHSLKEFQDFLTGASVDELPDTVQHFFKDCLSRSSSLQEKGSAKLIECADATLANLIAHDSRTKKYCQLAGERHLVVPIADETRFRNALRKVGYTMPPSSN